MVQNQGFAYGFLTGEILVGCLSADRHGIGFGQRPISSTLKYGDLKHFKKVLSRPNHAILFDVFAFALSLHQIGASGSKVYGSLHLWKVLRQYLRHRSRSEHHIPMVAAKDDVAVDAVDALGVFEVPVVGEFIDHKKADDQAHRHSRRKSQDVDQGVKLVLFEIPDRDEQVVL